MKGKERLLVRALLLNTHLPPARNTYYKDEEYLEWNLLTIPKLKLKFTDTIS